MLPKFSKHYKRSLCVLMAAQSTSRLTWQYFFTTNIVHRIKISRVTDKILLLLTVEGIIQKRYYKTKINSVKRGTLLPKEVWKTLVVTVLNQLRKVKKINFSRLKNLHLFLSTFYMRRKMKVNKKGNRMME